MPINSTMANQRDHRKIVAKQHRGQQSAPLPGRCSVATIFPVIALIASCVDGHRQKNAIMMIDFALEAERGQGMSPRTPSCSVAAPLRPIMMTTSRRYRRHAASRSKAGTGSELEIRSASPSNVAAQPVAHALHHRGDLTSPWSGSSSGHPHRRSVAPGPRAYRDVPHTAAE